MIFLGHNASKTQWHIMEVREKEKESYRWKHLGGPSTHTHKYINTRVTISAVVLPTYVLSSLSYLLFASVYFVYYIHSTVSFALLQSRNAAILEFNVGQKERERERGESIKPCGCYVVMHGLVIATIQPAYKRGSASIPNSDLRFIASGWIADFQIPQFVLINSSY